MREAIETQMADEKSLIEAYSFASLRVQKQFSNPGDDEIKEFIKGDGLRWSKGKLGNIQTSTVERDVIDSIRTQYAWWPQEHINQPFGSGTKVYEPRQVFEMIYDLEDSTEYEEPFDMLQILS